jgi:glycosyltransferase involved in cell wall biosynthesis
VSSSEPRLKVALVSEYFPHTNAGEITGGVESMSYYLARSLAARCDVTVYTSWREGFARSNEIAGVRVHRVGKAHRLAGEGAAFSRLRFARSACKALCERGGVDVVDAMNFTVYPHAYRAARSIGAAAVATWHEVWLGKWLWHKGWITGMLGSIWERHAMRLDWDRIIAVSDATAGLLKQHGVDARKIRTVHNGYDPKMIEHATDVQRNPFEIAAVGRVVKAKRLNTLLEAMSILARRNPPWWEPFTCHIVGAGEALAGLRDDVARCGLNEHVVFHPRIERHGDVIRFLASIGLLVQCSSVEGFGIVLVEANAVGTPVLASDIPPHREVIGLLGGNQLFPLGNAIALAEALREHFEGTPILPGDASCFHWPELAKRVEEVYREAIRDCVS